MGQREPLWKGGVELTPRRPEGAKQVKREEGYRQRACKFEGQRAGEWSGGDEGLGEGM